VPRLVAVFASPSAVPHSAPIPETTPFVSTWRQLPATPVIFVRVRPSALREFEKVLTSESKVEEAAVIVCVSPKEIDVPFRVIPEFWSMVFVIEPEGRETDDVAINVPTVRRPAVVEPM